MILDEKIPVPTNQQDPLVLDDDITRKWREIFKDTYKWFTATENMPVHRALIGWVGSPGAQGKEDVVKAIIDNPAEAAEIQSISQRQAEQKLGKRFTAWRGFGRGLPIERLRLFPYDSYTMTEDIAQAWAGEACGLGGIQGRGYYSVVEMPVENVLFYSAVHPVIQKMPDLTEAEIITNEKGGIGTRLIGIYRDDGTPLSAEEIEIVKGNNPLWFDGQMHPPVEILAIRSIARDVELVRISRQSWLDEINRTEREPLDENDQGYREYVGQQFRLIDEEWQRILKTAQEMAPYLLLPDEKLLS
ncbi:MAG: hypothetical protein WCV93_00880 [Candidatus Shapirobacteria bacterium]|jgi:hypothetical protein